jgi:hypothetical protein
VATRFTPFEPHERQIIAAALTRHADALDAFYADAAAADGVDAERIQAEATIARALHTGFIGE